MALTQNDMRQIAQMVREIVREELGAFMSQTRIEKVDESDVVADLVTLDPQGEVHEPVSRLETWGEVSAPPNDTDTLLLHNGFQGVQIPRGMPRYRPSGDATKAGAKGLYSDAGAQVLLHGKGSTTAGRIEVKSGNNGGAPEDVVVNGGTKKVSRVGDKTKGHRHVVTFTLQDSLLAPVTGTITIATATDEMAEGAEHLKA